MNEVKSTEKDAQLDELEVAMSKLPRVEIPVVNRFVEGMYIREVTIPEGAILTSMTHKTEHPFVISKGTIMVTSDNEGSVVYEAPYTGITKPHTRRALRALTETVWTTFHLTDETDVDKICDEILEKKDVNHIEQNIKGFIPQCRESQPEKQIWHS